MPFDGGIQNRSAPKSLPLKGTNTQEKDREEMSYISFLSDRFMSTRLQPFINFRGQISVRGFLFPFQKFSLIKKARFVFIENFPTSSLPKIDIVLEEKNSVFQVKEFNVSPSDNSVQGEILYTRLFLLISDARKCSLIFKDIDFSPFNFSFSSASSQDTKQMLYRAKLFRKLGFLEEFFKTKFTVPENITPNEAKQIDILFRGLTEGEFVTSIGSSVTFFNYKVTKSDLQNDSILGKKEFSFEFDEDLLVLGKFFPIGKMFFKVEKASIANPRTIRNVKEGTIIPNLRLNIFDSQVYHRFEKYANSERLLKNRQKLEHFKNYLRKVEPEFLVNLLDEPLAEVTDKAAIEIVTGWMQFYDFPDRYTVGEPVLEGNQWRVPIWLTYPNDKGVWLEDAFVNIRSGAIEISSSAEELRERGKRKAKEIFSVV